MLISPYARVFMREAAFCNSQDNHPVLATDGLRSCIGFAGWEPDKKIAFLVHFAGPDQVVDFETKGLSILENLVNKISSRFICVLTGGCEKTRFSGEILKRIKELNLPSYLKFEIIKEDVLSKSFVLKSLSIDSRNGQFGEYDSANDPNPRILTVQEMDKYQGFDSVQTLSYRNIPDFD